jgi:hypothetical protein
VFLNVFGDVNVCVGGGVSICVRACVLAIHVDVTGTHFYGYLHVPVSPRGVRGLSPPSLHAQPWPAIYSITVHLI